MAKQVEMFTTGYASPLAAGSYIAAKYHCSAPPNQPPSVASPGNRNGKIGGALRIRQPPATGTGMAGAMTQ